MQKSYIFFENSSWLIVLCLFLGAAYAYFLYQKKAPWSKKTNYLLSFLRFLLVSFLAILILAPLIEQVKNTYVRPVYLVAFDNSQSVAGDFEHSDLLKQVALLKEALEDEGYDIAFRSFDQKEISSLNDLAFDYPTTNIHHFFQSIKSDFEGRNLAGIIFLSDGIYNQGVSPEYTAYNFPIYTVGLGDTLPKIDVNLKMLYHNKVAYEGNKFPLIAEIQHNGFEDNEVKITIKREEKTIASQAIVLGKEAIQQVEFLLEADQKGLQHYVVSIDSLPGEFSIINNMKHAFIEVIEAKEKILLAAAAPHPDIKAILSALEQNKNYEVKLYIPGIHELSEAEVATLKLDVLILHQFPFKGNSPAQKTLELLLQQNTPTWYIIGNQSNLVQFNNLNTSLYIHSTTNETDQVFPSLAPRFNLFKVGEAFNNGLSYFPYLSVPFGDYSLSPNAEVLLYQKIGQVITEKPLFLFGRSNNIKHAILTGEGIWQWRIQEYAQTGISKGMDELISKTVQYLSAKEDKRRFKVYPIQNEFTDTEPVVFESEIYNALFEPIYNQSIKLEITNESGLKEQYAYSTSPANTTYRISGLSEGVYKYKAEGTIEGEKMYSEGEFSIAKLQLENLDLTANHHLLRKIAKNSNGQFYFPSELEKLNNDLRAKEAKSIIYSEEQYLPVIDLFWIFLLLLLLVSVEWFLRKYHGSY